MAKYPLERINTLPERVQDNFYSGDINEKYVDEIFPLLEEAQVEPVKDLVMDVYYKALTPEGFVSAVGEVVKDAEKARKVATLIMGYDFLPIADYLGADINALIAKHGGDPLIFRTKVAVSEVLERVLERAKVELEDDRLRTRLENILRSYIVDARKEEQALAMLMGSAKTSGVGLAEDAALSLVALAKEEKEVLAQRGVDIVADGEREKVGEGESEEAGEPSGLVVPANAGTPGSMSDKVPAFAGTTQDAGMASVVTGAPRPDTLAAAQTVKVKTPTIDAFTPEDAEDIKMAKKAIPTKVDVQQVGAVTTLEDGLADEVVAIVGAKIPDEDLQRRFLTVVRLFIRDIRDDLETKSKLTMPVGSGGLGMAEEEAARIMGVLTSKLAELRKLMEDKAGRERESYVGQQKAKHLQEQAVQQRKEAEGLDARFRSLTGKSPMEAEKPGVGVASLSEKRPVTAPTPKVIKVVDREKDFAAMPMHDASVPAAPIPEHKPVHASVAMMTPDISKVAPPSVHEVAPLADAGLGLPPRAVPGTGGTGEQTVSTKPVAAPQQPVRKTAPPPPELPVVEEPEGPTAAEEIAALLREEEEPFAIREVGDAIELDAREKQGSVPTSPAPKAPEPPRVAAVPAAPKLPSPLPSDLAAAAPKASMPPRPIAAPPLSSSVRPASPAVPPRPVAVPPPAPQPSVIPTPAPTPTRPVPAATPRPADSPTPTPQTSAPIAPKMSPRLMGPVDELRATTLADFRRLSKDPKEATLKVRDKIDLLENQSFEAKMQGVQAWRESEANKVYLEMLRASLEGTVITDVIAQRQSAGQPVFTKEEFEAIMTLNRELRFG